LSPEIKRKVSRFEENLKARSILSPISLETKLVFSSRSESAMLVCMIEKSPLLTEKVESQWSDIISYRHRMNNIESEILFAERVRLKEVHTLQRTFSD
jgi:hypothetical protein